jgi:hypothetical protein
LFSIVSASELFVSTLFQRRLVVRPTGDCRRERREQQELRLRDRVLGGVGQELDRIGQQRLERRRPDPERDSRKRGDVPAVQRKNDIRCARGFAAPKLSARRQ